MLAIALANPDIALEEDEAKRLGKSFTKMQRHYGGSVSAKMTDTLAFVMCAASIEGPRLLPMVQKFTAKPGKKSASVTSIRPVEDVG
jgi:hypothetical protein